MTANNKKSGQLEECLIPINTDSESNVEISNASSTSNNPQKFLDSLSTSRRVFKCKARFGDPSLPLDKKTLENLGNAFSRRISSENSASVTRGIPRDVGVSGTKSTKHKHKKNDDPDEREIYRKITSQLRVRDRKRMTIKFSFQLLVFLLILSCLISSLTLNWFKGRLFLGVEIWKWFVLVMVTFSGMFVIKWFVHVIVFLIEWKFMLEKNVVYFTHGVRSSVEVFIWIGVVLCTWCLLTSDVKNVYKGKKVLRVITMTLTSLLVGSFLWLMKTTCIKILASLFHMNRFFDRIQETLYHYYVFQTLSGSPVFGLSGAQPSFPETAGTSNKNKKEAVNWTKLQKMRQDNVPSWTMKLLVDVVLNSGLSTVSGTLKEGIGKGGVDVTDDEITGEEAAIAAAVRTFYNVVGDKNDLYIDKSDLHRFLLLEEVNIVHQFFEVNDEGQIDIKAFCKWVVKVFKDRQALQYALSDSKTAVDDLNKIFIGIVIIITVVLWLLLTEIVNTKLLLFISSQLLVAAFIFGNTCKTIFEAIIFVFVAHPLMLVIAVLSMEQRYYSTLFLNSKNEIGVVILFFIVISFIDVVAMLQMIVEEMNILTTVFLKADNEKVSYPNSVLATKPISNFYRSPHQGDSLEFGIDYQTPLTKIAELKKHIKQYLEENPNYWHPNHQIAVKEIENINMLKMALSFHHTINFQDNAERNKRRSELVLEMKNIFDTLKITYSLLPQQVVLSDSSTNRGKNPV